MRLTFEGGTPLWKLAYWLVISTVYAFEEDDGARVETVLLHTFSGGL